jgi:flagellar hook assembly protein FlgD
VEKISSRLPFSYTLNQNYPNPFNPVTQIEYNIARSGVYKLMIYNALGQKIITLADQEHSPGSYRIKWDGIDQNGLKVGSGMYFYVLQGEGVQLTKKMLLIK